MYVDQSFLSCASLLVALPERSAFSWPTPQVFTPCDFYRNTKVKACAEEMMWDSKDARIL
jgi:hypothetical protein